MLKFLLLILYTLLFFSACTKKEKQDELMIKGYLEVEAICSESIGDEKVLFEGFLVDVYNKTQNSGFRHGSVYFKKTLMQHSQKYLPANEVKFTKITPETFEQPVMHLSGLSHRTTNRDVFKASCTIKVLKRLEHQPK